MIIDAHVHVGSPPHEAEPDRFIRLMESSGIDRAIICRYVPGKPTLKGNKLIRSAVRKYPDRFVGFVWVDPNEDTAEKEVKRAIVDWGFKGIKLHMGMMYASADRSSRVFEEAERLGVPIYVHVGEHFGLVDSLSQAFNVDVIMGHLGVGVYNLDFLRIEKATELAAKHDNILVETSGNTFYFIDYAVKKLGASKVVFGSDFPHEHPLVIIKAIEILDLSDTDKARILGENVGKLIDL